MKSKCSSLGQFIHSHLLKLLIFIYLLSVLAPNVGVAMKDYEFAKLKWNGTDDLTITLPMIMLSILLLNAGLSVKLLDLKKVFHTPVPLFIGLVSNVMIPLLFTITFSYIGDYFYHNSDGVQNVLVGLAIISSMPIAGSSATWVQNVNGNPALIFGLVVFSTLISPLLSPFVFHAVGYVTNGDYSEDLHQLGNQGASSFLIFSVVIPSFCGIVMRAFINDYVWDSIFPVLKTLNLMNLLALNYLNASSSLPIAFKNKDPDFILMIIVVTNLLCLISFSAGWFIPKFFKVPLDQRISLTYGLGMNNNGTGLVLASSTMREHPLILLPIIFYNLGQQIIAGLLDSKFLKFNKTF